MTSNDTYIIYAPNGVGVEVNKKTNEIYFSTGTKEAGKYNKKHSDIYFKSHKLRDSSPYKSYKPIYLDPSLKTGQSSTYVEFKKWQDLYLKPPVKAAIAPWTKKEKAYYQSLKTKRERYKYLIIRSGLRSAVIDIPYDAYCGVDDNGKLINKDYKDLYKEVERNRGNTHLSKGYLFMGEWELAAGILGDVRGFALAQQIGHLGFKARMRQISFLTMQLAGIGEINSYTKIPHRFKSYADKSEFGLDGIHKDMLRAQMILNLSQTIKPDEFNMLPFLDELMGVDWVMDFSKYDVYGDVMEELYIDGYTYQGLINKGLLKDPRDTDSTKESRKEFMQKTIFLGQRRAEASALYYPDSPTFSTTQSALEYDTVILYAKIMAVTPPQGYPNAPTYYIPEYLDELYQAGKLDKRLNPTIPAILRESFPEELRDKIEWYAKKHNIKN